MSEYAPDLFQQSNVGHWNYMLILSFYTFTSRGCVVLESAHALQWGLNNHSHQLRFPLVLQAPIRFTVGGRKPTLFQILCWACNTAIVGHVITLALLVYHRHISPVHFAHIEKHDTSDLGYLEIWILLLSIDSTFVLTYF